MHTLLKAALEHNTSVTQSHNRIHSISDRAETTQSAHSPHVAYRPTASPLPRGAAPHHRRGAVPPCGDLNGHDGTMIAMVGGGILMVGGVVGGWRRQLWSVAAAQWVWRRRGGLRRWHTDLSLIGEGIGDVVFPSIVENLGCVLYGVRNNFSRIVNF